MYASAAQPFPASGPRRRSSQRVRRARTLRCLLLALVAVAVFVVAPRAVDTMARTEAPVFVEHVVAPGDSLWTIASQHSGTKDVREVIAAIKRLNGLKTATVHPGQVLMIPQVR